LGNEVGRVFPHELAIVDAVDDRSSDASAVMLLTSRGALGWMWANPRTLTHVLADPGG